MKIDELCAPYKWCEDGFYKGDERIANFCPLVEETRIIEDKQIVVLTLFTVYGERRGYSVEIEKLAHLDWFSLCTLCLVDDDTLRARKILTRFVQWQIAEYEGERVHYTVYNHLGWTTRAYGDAVYVCGNMVIGAGESEKIQIDPRLGRFKLETSEGKEEEFLKIFSKLLQDIPDEGLLLLNFSIMGLLKGLLKDAGIPTSFLLFCFGEQQYRKSALATALCNLYCRASEEGFAVRVISKLTESVAEKLINDFRDTTLIFDDLAMTADKQVRARQERMVEIVTRNVGNRALKNTNQGGAIKDYSPNANVLITAEYLPNFPQSVLTRMIILELKHPVDKEWLTDFTRYPELLSTIAYIFLGWVQKHYNACVDLCKSYYSEYKKLRRNRQVSYQERLQENAFAIQMCSFLWYCFLQEKIQNRLIVSKYFQRNTLVLRQIMENQVDLIDKYAMKKEGMDFCKAFATLLTEGQLSLANEKEDYQWFHDGFFGKNRQIICVSPSKMRTIMTIFFAKRDITIKAVSKQFKECELLVRDKSGSSTKKIEGRRYFHISKEALYEYYTLA